MSFQTIYSINLINYGCIHTKESLLVIIWEVFLGCDSIRDIHASSI
jgi:hypothetical protein